MFLKLMSDEDLMDDNTSKGCTIVSNVIEAKYSMRPSLGEASIDVTYSMSNRGTDTETFTLKGNAYLMNDNGKTIQSFACVRV